MINPLIDVGNPAYRLDVEIMDETHEAFIELVNRLGEALDKVDFSVLFKKLVEHTEYHFEIEKLLMEQTGFPAIREHTDEHLRILGDLHRLNWKLKKGSIVIPRIYVVDHLPRWFDIHAATMDSALAAHLQRHGGIQEPSS